MIISITENNRTEYNALFKKAYEELLAEGKIEANAEGRFTSLNEFFAHMSDLYELDPVYTMLPLDEEPFEINANTRTIKVPASFSKAAGLQKDHMAEMIVFTIDRYFDYMDLANTTIYVQWTAGGVEGASLVPESLYDLETFPGKIRFGWPLTSEITANPGTVKFSVRLFRKDNTTGAIVYSFNTLTADITIKAALQPDINDQAQVDDPSDAFLAAIVNSQYAAEGVVVPATPDFNQPGLNLPLTTNLENNTLTLKAQAVVRDTGLVSYRWERKPLAEESVWAEVEGVVGEEYVAIPNTQVGRVLKETYYIDGVNGKEEYFGPIPAENNVVVYEKLTTYTVPAEGEVTGHYRVAATNHIDPNTSKEVYSKECLVPAPNKIVATKDLPVTALIESDDKPAKLSVIIAEDKTNPQITYAWFKSVSGEEEGFESIEGAAADLNVTTPGWYKVDVTSELNRNTDTFNSVACKVTGMPLVPSLVLAEGQSEEIHATLNDEVTMKVSSSIDIPEGQSADLYSEGFDYIWEFRTGSNDYRVLTTADPVVVSGLNTPELTIKCLIDTDIVTGFYQFQCTAVNKLNGKVANSNPIDFIVR